MKHVKHEIATKSIFANGSYIYNFFFLIYIWSVLRWMESKMSEKKNCIQDRNMVLSVITYERSDLAAIKLNLAWNILLKIKIHRLICKIANLQLSISFNSLVIFTVNKAFRADLLSLLPYIVSALFL